MQFRQLGRSGLRVSALTLGTMTFGGAGAFAKVGATDVEGAGRLVDRCRDAGVNMLDTANIYSNGLSEEIIGQVMHGRWGDMLVATKARMRTGAGPNGGGSSRQHLVGEVEKSLRRLRRDHIDLFYLHEWDGETPLEETMSALDDLVRAGKIRYIGASNFSAWHLMKAQWTADRMRTAPFISQQIHYSLQSREAEYELVPVALDQGLGILVWSPLTGGLLTGKYRRDVKGPEGSRHLNEWNEPPIHDEGKLWDIVDVLVDVAERRGVPPAQIALAWLLGRPAVTSLVIGARNEDQLAVNLGCLDVELTAEDRNRLDLVSAPTLIYPYWHQAWTASDRLSPADLSLLAPHVAARSGGASPGK
jgi:aryl-alcohol dehydrogenase-like predicted oxidoreductase